MSGVGAMKEFQEETRRLSRLRAGVPALCTIETPNTWIEFLTLSGLLAEGGNDDPKAIGDAIAIYLQEHIFQDIEAQAAPPEPEEAEPNPGEVTFVVPAAVIEVFNRAKLLEGTSLTEVVRHVVIERANELLSEREPGGISVTVRVSDDDTNSMLRSGFLSPTAGAADDKEQVRQAVEHVLEVALHQTLIGFHAARISSRHTMGTLS
jgi:hypothetical protein